MFGAIFSNSFHLLSAFSFRNSYFPEFTFFVEIFLAHALCIPHSNQSNSALCHYVCASVCVCATCLSLRLSLCLCQVVFPTQAGHLQSEASFKILCSFHVAHIRDTHCTLTYTRIQMSLCVCVWICVWCQPLLSRESHPVCPEPVSASNEFPCSCRCASFFLSVLLYLILQVLRRLLCLPSSYLPWLQVLPFRFSRTSLSTFLLLCAILLPKNGQFRQ